MSVVKDCTSYRVSSVLNRDVKQFGKKHLIDGNNDTCWNSDQGKTQWILFTYEDGLNIKSMELSIQFQGGFCGKSCSVELREEIKSDECLCSNFYPDDVNKLQTFKLEFDREIVAKSMKIVFNESTDFFGRIIVYKIDINCNTF